MSWRLAKSLDVLRTQVNNAYPDRSKVSDGTIGDSSHASTPSDHNPNAKGVVCAMDITHDPAHGFDAGKFVEAQRKFPHRDLKYMIFNRTIYSRKYGWVARPSSGHEHHVHVSVGVGTDGKSVQPYDDQDLWIIKTGSIPIEESEVFKVKNFEAAIVKVQTGNNGAGQKIIRLSKGGLIMVGSGWMGSSSKGLTCSYEQGNGNEYKINVEGAPGAYTISVNVLFAEK